MERFVENERGEKRSPHLEFLRGLFGESDSLSVLNPGLRSVLTRTDDAGWVLFLVDGYGVMNHQALGGTAYPEWEMNELAALWPTTTACFMTSFHTGMPSSSHGITGWWSYSERDRAVVAPLTGGYLHNGKPAFADGYDPIQATALPFINRRGPKFDYRWFTLKSYWLSPYSNASHRSITGLGRSPYTDYADLKSVFSRRLEGLKTPPRWVVYLPNYDHEAHFHGAAADETAAEAKKIENLVEELAALLPPGTETLLSSDHGIIDVGAEKYFELVEDSPLIDTLSALPYGEPRQPLFRTKAGREEDFLLMWNDAPWAEDFELLRQGELFERNLFSAAYPRPKQARVHWEAFIAVPKTAAVIQYLPEHNKPPRFIGFHGGPSEEESRISIWRKR